MSIRSRLLHAFNETFRGRHHVYRYEGDPGRDDPRLALERHECEERIPADTRQAILRWGGEAAWIADALELMEGSTMYVGRQEGAPVSVWLARPGRLFRRWLVPLGPEDVVLFRGRTAPEWRGRGLSPAMMRAVVARERAPGAEAYVDVSVHNTPSIRAIEKAGFRRFATRKPLTRKEAYGEIPPGKLLGCPFAAIPPAGGAREGALPRP